MTTLESRPNTALVVIDVQNDVVERAHERDAVVANVGSLVEKARQEVVPVVWVQHSDEDLPRESDGWRIVHELTPGDAEPLVEKHYRGPHGMGGATAGPGHRAHEPLLGLPPLAGRTAGTVESKDVDFGGTS